MQTECNLLNFVPCHIILREKKIRACFTEVAINLQVNQSVQQLTDTDGFLFTDFYS